MGVLNDITVVVIFVVVFEYALQMQMLVRCSQNCYLLLFILLCYCCYLCCCVLNFE